MNTRARRIMNIIKTKNEECQTTSKRIDPQFSSIIEFVEPDELPQPLVMSNDIQVEPHTLLHGEKDSRSMNDSSDTNSLPDSQHNLDVSLLDEISLSDYGRPEKRPNFVVEESASDSESDSDSSDSSSTSSGTSSTTDFSSDDSVQDPDFKVHAITNSDSDEDIQDSCFEIQQLNVEDQLVSIGSQAPNVEIHKPTDSLEIRSLTSVEPEPPSVEPPSVEPSSVESLSVESPSVEHPVDLQRGSRKRKANPGLWKTNVSKLLRNSGKAYTSMAKSKKLMNAKKMGPTCSDKCKFKCGEIFSSNERYQVFETYWHMADLQAQRRFIYSNMTTLEPKYRYIRVGSTRQNFNHGYYLPRENKRIRVCKVFFMNTLAVSDKTIRTVVKKTCNLMDDQLKECRGKHDNHHKLCSNLTDGVKVHINSIPRIESHYCRAQTKREYIEGGYTVAALHRDYVELCKAEGTPHVSYQIYYNIFMNDFNISFWCPKKDQCEDCTAYKNAENKALLQEKYDLHLKEKCLVRLEKEKDKENVGKNFVVAVYDLQAVMPCPRGEVSSFYYVSKLNLLNFTITELGTKNTTCFVWHEGEGGRGANEIGSCVFMYLKSLHDKATEDFDIVFYSDNCCGQQKNKFMLAMYQYAINEFPKIKSITHKFLIKGHTQNEGDAVHSIIQRNINSALKSSPIYVPDQYITLIKTAKKKGTPFTVKELTHESFMNLKSLAIGNYTTNENGGKVKWADLKVIKTDKEHKNMFLYKTSYEDAEFTKVTTLNRRQNSPGTGLRTVKKLYANKLQVAAVKKQGILNLIEKNVIPRYYKTFYTNL